MGRKVRGKKEVHTRFLSSVFISKSVMLPMIETNSFGACAWVV